MLDSRNRDSVKRELVEALGSQRVLWAKADLLPYSKDTYRSSFVDENKYLPDMVVLPETTAHVQSVVRIASEHRVPIIPKGGGSNRTGMLVPITGGIVIDTIRMNRVLEVDVANLHVTVQPGITLKELDEHLAAHNLWLTQEQGSYKVATIGGAISTSGFSRRHQKYGTIADRVMSLEVVLANGSVLRTGQKVLYTSTGYRLHQLFIGAEGTLGVITEATLRVEPLPEARDVVLGFFKDFWAANDAAQKVMASGVMFTGGEAYEGHNIQALGAPEGMKGLFYVMLDGIKGEVEADAAFIERMMRESGGTIAEHETALAFLSGYTIQWCGARALTGFEDVLTSYVPMERIREFYDTLWNDIAPRYGIEPLPGEKYSLDVGRYRMSGGRYRLPKGEDAWQRYQGVLREIAELATSLGGSIQGCHGVGIEHRDNLNLEFSEVALDTMRMIKSTFDPDNLMNPGKKIPDRR